MTRAVVVVVVVATAIVTRRVRRGPRYGFFDAVSLALGGVFKGHTTAYTG